MAFTGWENSNIICILKIARLHLHAKTKAHFTLGVKANVQLKSSIPIGAKVEISPKGFKLGVKAEIGKTFSICPKLVINAEFYGLVCGH
jgi:hypothetical protein